MLEFCIGPRDTGNFLGREFIRETGFDLLTYRLKLSLGTASFNDISVLANRERVRLVEYPGLNNVYVLSIASN